MVRVRLNTWALLIPCVLVALVAALSQTGAGVAAAQKPANETKTVWDGVYTGAQAVRGGDVYALRCARCHSRPVAPSLFEDGAFMRRWFEDSLNAPFAKMQADMPEDAPGSLAENVYIDILSYVLAESGFPGGSTELTPASLGSILVVDKAGVGGPVPNFSLVQVVGCLGQRPDDVWILTNSSEPTRAREPGALNEADLQKAEAKALGKQSFRLLDFYPSRDQQAWKGEKVHVRGLLISKPDDSRLNVTTVQSFGQSCAP